jgi:hypothetical protein
MVARGRPRLLRHLALLGGTGGARTRPIIYAVWVLTSAFLPILDLDPTNEQKYEICRCFPI